MTTTPEARAARTAHPSAPRSPPLKIWSSGIRTSTCSRPTAERQRTVDERIAPTDKLRLETAIAARGLPGYWEATFERQQKEARGRAMPAIDRARVCVRVGRRSEALALLEGAFARHGPRLAWLKGLSRSSRRFRRSGWRPNGARWARQVDIRNQFVMGAFAVTVIGGLLGSRWAS